MEGVRASRAEAGYAQTLDREVRAELLPYLPEGFFKKSPGRLAYLAAAWLCLGLHLYVTTAWLGGRLSTWHYALTLCAASLTYPYYLFTLHEISHGAVVESRRARQLLGAAAGFFILFQPLFWSQTHRHHHAHTNMEADNDRLRRYGGAEPGGRLMDFRPGSPLGLFSAMFAVQMNYFVLMLGFLIKQVPYPLSRRRVLFQLALNLAGLFAAFYSVGWRVVLVGFLPAVVLGSVIQNMFIITNHLTRPMTTERDSLGTTTSVHFFGLSPMDFGRHVEHHLFPNVSHRKLHHVTRALRSRYPRHFRETQLLRAVVKVFSLPSYYYLPRVLSDRSGRRQVAID